MSKRKSLKASLKEENLNGVTSLATNKLAESLIAMEDEINLDFLNTVTHKEVQTVKKEEIVIKRTQFIFVRPRRSQIMETLHFPTSQAEEESCADLLSCLSNNLLGKWSIENNKPFTSEMLDNLVLMCLLENATIATSATEYFLDVFDQMMLASSQVSASKVLHVVP